ncbi:MAG TPA: alpha/beta hydrolase [Caulobacteraceae bacterium]|jgi:pimeloyl-ACP methyl ester carboxylesterase|nr:alpha/beta hydrolase [Caulobacteraceae bacterium]
MAKQHVETRVGDIAYVDRGEGPVALFVHGVFLNSHVWRHVIDRLCGERRCIAVDLLAHGDTLAGPDQDVSLRAEADMLEAFCEAMGLAQVDLVANDSACAIAQIFAVRQPERLRSLTLTNGDTHDNYPPADFAPTIALAAAGVFSQQREAFAADPELLRGGFATGYEDVDKVSPETLATYVRPLVATPEATRNLERWLVALQDTTQTTEIAPQLRQLRVPTLVVWGAGDPFFPVAWAYWLKGAIPGVRKVVELEGAKLFFPEERPDELAEALREHWQVTSRVLEAA